MTRIQPGDRNDFWLSKPGKYRSATADGGKRTAILSCPDCGQSVSLRNHDIAADGSVTPSLVCPRSGCTFHDYVKLEGWDG